MDRAQSSIDNVAIQVLLKCAIFPLGKTPRYWYG